MPTTHEAQLRHWTDAVQRHLPTLSRTQASALSAFSFAATLARSGSLLRCAALVALIEHAPMARLRQRLREFYLDAPHKRGRARRTVDVWPCFTSLLGWALNTLAPKGDIVLALDPTLCRDRLACLAISLVTDETAIPVAWRIVTAQHKGAWLAPYLRLIEQMAQAVRTSADAHRRVYVLGDRGLFSKALFEAVVAVGWHPLFRVPANGLWRTRRRRVHLRQVVAAPGACYAARGVLHKAHPLVCTLVGLWSERYKEPWLIVTDARPAQAQAQLYRLRTKIERVFRTVKSDVFDWEHSRITEPERAERMWLVYAVGMLLLAHHGQSAQSSAASLRSVGLCHSDVWDRLGRRMSVMRVGQIVLWRLVFGQAPATTSTPIACNSS